VQPPKPLSGTRARGAAPCGGAPARPAAARAPAARRSRPPAWPTSRAAARPPTAPPAARGGVLRARTGAREGRALAGRCERGDAAAQRPGVPSPRLACEVSRPHTVLGHWAARGAASLWVCRGAPPRPRRAAGRRRRGRRRAACAPPDPGCTPRAPGTQCPPPPGSPRAAALLRSGRASQVQHPEAHGALAVAKVLTAPPALVPYMLCSCSGACLHCHPHCLPWAGIGAGGLAVSAGSVLASSQGCLV
jgi:hypothetical protein